MLLPSRKTVSSTARPLSLSERLQCSDHPVELTSARTNAPWGLARISSGEKLANQDSSALTFTYKYDSTAGSGATVFIIGTQNASNPSSSINSRLSRFWYFD